MPYKSVKDSIKEDDAWFLGLFDALPDLLHFARRRGVFWRWIRRASPYPAQEKLRERCRRGGLAFRYSMPLRHYGHCDQCDERFTEVSYELENPHARSEETRKLFMRESQIHAIRVHGGSFTETQRAFFRELYEGLYEPGPDKGGTKNGGHPDRG